ncbi:helix-hairpin-helix domain-containing protein [Pseudonocardia sp. RS010]|uniref:helix-hairpin-helix domain-containing protein n=1 Tax=Pseudonocardia sp. RS010 TaxID=3385979 RepID=UPI0039A33D62
MTRSSPHTRSAARLSALLGTPVGRPYPASGIVGENTRASHHPPLPPVSRPALPRRAAADEDPPTVPLPVSAGPVPAPGRHRAGGPTGNPHFAALLAGMDEPAVVGAAPGAAPGAAVGAAVDAAVEDDAGPADEWPDGARGSHDPGSRPGRHVRVAARWVPAAWRGSRLDPGRAGALALVLVAAVAAVVAAVGVWSTRPRPEQIPPLPAVSLDSAAESSTRSSAPPPTATPTELVVSVTGKVRRPGLVRVPDGSRVADVLEAAGGALPGTDLGIVNLARRVADGEQVAVGVPAAPDAGGTQAGPAPAGGDAGATVAGRVDLNRATVEQLDGLPGVGPVTAQRILDWRTRNGRFARVDQLREVEGIGERRFAQLRDLVTV